MEKVNLYCLPFAGGSRYSYREYVTQAPSFLNVIPIEIPGRGSRSNEKQMTSLVRVAEDVFNQIKHDLRKPYVIYGHSMGSLLGYLVTKKIVQENLNQPLHLFFTGCVGPSLRYKDQVDYLLPKNEFFQKIRELGGSSDAVLDDATLMDYFEPILRADFEAVTTYRYEAPTPFDIPISIVIGEEENATYEEAMTWQQETTAPVDVRQLPGNHFFILGHEMKILEMLSDKLNVKIQ